MSNLFVFNKLSLQQKQDFITLKGAFLTERIVDNTQYKLYRLFDFYVELACQFSSEKTIQIESVSEEYISEHYINIEGLD